MCHKDVLENTTKVSTWPFSHVRVSRCSTFLESKPSIGTHRVSLIVVNLLFLFLLGGGSFAWGSIQVKNQSFPLSVQLVTLVLFYKNEIIVCIEWQTLLYTRKKIQCFLLLSQLFWFVFHSFFHRFCKVPCHFLIFWSLCLLCVICLSIFSHDNIWVFSPRNFFLISLIWLWIVYAFCIDFQQMCLPT